MKTRYEGIDYSLGTANVDTGGIHYGVVNANHLAHWIWDEVEALYWHGCPNCGSDFEDDKDFGPYGDDGTNCPHCGVELNDGDQWGDEPMGYRYDADGILIEGGTDGDLFVIKSPVVANLQFCSPCAPGAGYMQNPCDSGPVCYVLPSDWWEEGQCPYSPSELT